MEKLAMLIKQRRETYLPSREKEEMRRTLRGAVEAALGNNHAMNNCTFNLLLDDKNILEATKALKVSKEKKDQAAQLEAYQKLIMLLGNARLDFRFSDL